MKIGIFGGSFNPIHTGHCILANYILQNSDLDEIWLTVANQNPLKTEHGESNAHRLNMVNAAIEPCRNLKACDIEFSMPQPSYTIDTLQRLNKEYPDDEFTLIIGSDNWDIFHKWKDSEKIIRQFGLLVYPRRGYTSNLNSTNQNVKFIDAPLIEISSSFIRASIKDGKNMNFFLPEKVYKYIIQHKLYL